MYCDMGKHPGPSEHWTFYSVTGLACTAVAVMHDL